MTLAGRAARGGQVSVRLETGRRDGPTKTVSPWRDIGATALDLRRRTKAGGGAEDDGQVGWGELRGGMDGDALAGIVHWQRGMALADVSAAAGDSSSPTGSAQTGKCDRWTSAQKSGGYHTPLTTEVRTERF